MAEQNILDILKLRFEEDLDDKDKELNTIIYTEVYSIDEDKLEAELTKYSVSDIPPTDQYTSLEQVNAYNEKFRFAIEYRKDMKFVYEKNIQIRNAICKNLYLTCYNLLQPFPTSFLNLRIGLLGRSAPTAPSIHS